MNKSTATRRCRTDKPGLGAAPKPRIKLVTVEQSSSSRFAANISSKEDVSILAKRLLSPKDREHFIVFHLDGANRVVSFETAFIGSLTQCTVHPREVFKAAILANARSIICVHNHPSGNVNPSDADRRVFDSLRDAGTLLGIQLLDFLIVSGDVYWAASEDWF